MRDFWKVNLTSIKGLSFNKLSLMHVKIIKRFFQRILFNNLPSINTQGVIKQGESSFAKEVHSCPQKRPIQSPSIPYKWCSDAVCQWRCADCIKPHINIELLQSIQKMNVNYMNMQLDWLLYQYIFCIIEQLAPDIKCQLFNTNIVPMILWGWEKHGTWQPTKN